MDLGEISVHFNERLASGKIYMDYRYVHEGCEYLVTDIPCKHWPINTTDYLETYVSAALNIIMECQKEGSVPNVLNFQEHEHLMIDLKNHFTKDQD